MSGSSTAYIVKRYRLILIIYAIVSIFFLTTNYRACVVALRTFFSENTLILIATSQHLIIGGAVGLIILIVLSRGLGMKARFSFISIIRELIVFVSLLLWSIVLTDITYISASTERIILWSQIFMGLDRAIFKVYPAFFMYSHYNAVFERIIVWTYNIIPILAACWTGYMIAAQKIDEFKEWSKRIFLALGFCIPLWIAFPAIQPLSMYVVNIFDQPIPADVSREISLGPPSPFIDRYTRAYADMWIDPAGIRRAVSNFPSMHTIWGLLLFLSIASVFKSRYLNLLFFAIACVNMLGALYTLQHYAVDIIAGILVCICTVSCSRITNPERRAHRQADAFSAEVPLVPEREV